MGPLVNLPISSIPYSPPSSSDKTERPPSGNMPKAKPIPGIPVAKDNAPKAKDLPRSIVLPPISIVLSKPSVNLPPIAVRLSFN